MTTEPAKSRGDGERRLRVVPESASEKLTIAQAVRDALRGSGIADFVYFTDFAGEGR